MKVARDYQERAIAGIDTALANHKSAIVVMATGLGKAYVLSRVANEWTKGNVLCLAHRIELVDQLADTLAGELGYRPAIEQGPRGIDPDSLFAAGHVVVGSIQSMITENRIRKFSKHPFGLIEIDECHRACSPSYVKLIDRYRELDPQCRLLGCTATANRSDGTAMGLVFDTVAFEMGIIEGIDTGWLVDIHQKFAVCEELDLSKIPLTRNEFGEVDFKPAELEALLTQEGPLHAMSRPVLDCTPNGEQAIIFTASVSHAHLWAAVLNHYRPNCAAAIDGTMIRGEGSLRSETVKQYKNGDLQFLLNHSILTEGFDAPNTSFIIMGRPTKSILVKTQQLGRGTRPLPGVVDGFATPEERKDAIAASPKKFATALDFVGNLKGNDIVTCSDILGGNYDVDVRAAADDIIGSQRNQEANVRDSLNKARASMLLEAEEERRKPIRNAIKGTKVTYHIGDVGNFGGKTVQAAPKTNRGGATDGQVAALVNLGVSRDTALGYSRKQAGAVMTNLRDKRCTVKQAATLSRFGIDPSTLNAKQASEQIDKIAKNGWRQLA